MNSNEWINVQTSKDTNTLVKFGTKIPFHTEFEQKKTEASSMVCIFHYLASSIFFPHHGYFSFKPHQFHQSQTKKKGDLASISFFSLLDLPKPKGWLKALWTQIFDYQKKAVASSSNLQMAMYIILIKDQETNTHPQLIQCTRLIKL